MVCSANGGTLISAALGLAWPDRLGVDGHPRGSRSPGWAELVGGFQHARRAVNPEDELVERARQGDRAAFKTLFLAHRAQVARLVQRFVAANEVEDVSQEVFLHVHRSLGSFRGESRFSTWLYRLTLNVTRMHVRKQQSRPKLALAGDDEHGRLERTEPETPASEAERNERLAALKRLVHELPEKKREALDPARLRGAGARKRSPRSSMRP